MTILWPNGSTTPPLFSWQGHFGWRKSDAPNASRYHRGLDMYDIGTVRAIADGVVVAVGWGAGYGWGGGYQVWIQHDGFFTRSLHLVAGSALVRVGDHVTAGQAIGTEGMTGAYQVHLHLEITPGQWHAYNSGQIDPKAWLFEHVTAGAGGGGVTNPSTPDSPTQSEEDDMPRLYRIKETGRHYSVAPGFIKQIKSKTSVKAYEDAHHTLGFAEIEVSEWSFGVILGTNGIPSDVLDSQGRVRNDVEGQGEYVHGGEWFRSDKAERWAYLAQKG